MGVIWAVAWAVLGRDVGDIWEMSGKVLVRCPVRLGTDACITPSLMEGVDIYEKLVIICMGC